MAMSGFALGGAADGFNQARQTGIQQQQANQQGSYQQGMLKLQQQSQQNQQQRELFARADKDAASLMTTATDTISALQLQGKSPAEISKAIQPIVQPLKRLMQSAGRDSSAVDAQIAVSLSKPGFNPSSVTGGGSSPQSAAQPASSADVPTGTPAAPGQNLTGDGTTVTSVEYGPVETSGANGQPVASPASSRVQPQQNDVDRLTKVLMTVPATPEAANIREAVKVRLADAIKKSDTDSTVHFMKTEDGGELPLVIKKQGSNVSITDTNGNPYVAPTGGNTDTAAIGDAIISGKQPPTTTGLYKNSKAVKAYLSRKDFDLAGENLKWQAAQKQVASLNGPQMTRFYGLATSVDKTIDEVRNLSKELDNSGVPLANAVKLSAYMQTEGNTPNGQLAARYIGAVNTLKEEFANLAQGGYAPTEAAWALANQQINGNYGVKQLDASLTEVQRLIRYRVQGIPNGSKLGPASSNRYTGSGGGESHAPAAGGSQAVPYTDYFK